MTSTFRLAPDEPVPDGMRRIAREQIDEARSSLQAPTSELDEGIHDTRKRLKRLRASVRLARDAIGDETYDRENTAFRDLGRSLSGARDATVLIETLDNVREREGDALPRTATADVRARLVAEHDRELAAVAHDDIAIGDGLDELEIDRIRTTTWTFDGDGIEALTPGLKRIYRRGRKAMREADDDPTDEHLHESRKRSKDLWHAAQILRPAAPKRMKKLARRAHRLADALGDDHDLAQLRTYVDAHPDCFRSPADQIALCVAIDRRRTKLQKKALHRGSRIYRRRPKRFVRGVERRRHAHMR